MAASDVNEQRLNEHDRRLDKYDTIIESLQNFVARFDAAAKANGVWIKATLAVAIAAVTALMSILLYIVTHIH